MEFVEDVKKIINDLQVFGEKADHANKLITMNKNILENINLTDKFHQLHESSIEVKLSDLNDPDQGSHYHHAPVPTTERGTTRLILSLMTESTNFELETEQNTFQTYLPDTSSQSPESDIFGLETTVDEVEEVDLVLQNSSSTGLSLVGTMLVGNLNGSDLISTTCSSSTSTSSLTVYIVFGVVLVFIILLLLALWLFLTRWRKGGKKGSQRTQRATKRPSRGAESFL